MTKVCFACSAGGHLNQLKELIGKIECDEYFFVTLDREDSKELLKKEKKYYVKDTDKNILNTAVNAFQSFKIILKERPDYIITNGGGSALPTCYVAKLFGTKIIFIESFARINEPSIFGKLIKPISNKILIQWKELQKYYPKATYSGPIFSFNTTKSTKKEKLIFVTIGSSEHQFNRLIKKIDEIKIPKGYKIFAQIGKSKYIPKIPHKEYLTLKEMNSTYAKSEIVICHAGTGTIINALINECRVIVVPRNTKFKENVDNHQIDITKKFSELGLIDAIYDIKNLEKEINKKINNKKIISIQKESKVSTIINKYIKNEN